MQARRADWGAMAWLILLGGVGSCSSQAVSSGKAPEVGILPTVPAAPAGGKPAPSAGSGAALATGAAGMAVTASAGPGVAGTGGAGSASPAANGGAPAVAGNASAAAGSTATAAGSGSAGVSAAAAGASGSAAGSGAAEPGGFPKTDEVNIKSTGPYIVKTYTEGLDDPEYMSSMMYYPEGAQPPFAVVAFTPGYTASKENYTFLGYMLASHGIAALLTTPTSTQTEQPPARGKDLVAAVKHIKAENERAGSPVQGKLATDRICVTGHSMGGGGSLFAADELGSMIRCVMPLQPWQPSGSFSKIAAPTMILGAASDTIASVSGNAQPHYQSIPNSTEKFLVVFEGDHYLSTNRTSTDQSAPEEATPSYDIQAAYIIPFYKLFLENDERYRPYLYGAMRSMMGVTRFEKSNM